MESAGVQSTAACLMIRLIASFGTGKGSDPPPLPHPTRRDDSVGEHTLSLWQETWAVINVCISS